MKKILSIVLAAVLCFSAVPSFARDLESSLAYHGEALGIDLLSLSATKIKKLLDLRGQLAQRYEHLTGDKYSGSLFDQELSALSYSELVALQREINLTIWESDTWQSVTVPEGLWKIGVDIPAGKWVIHPYPKNMLILTYGAEIEADGNGVNYWSSSGGFHKYVYGEGHSFLDEGEAPYITVTLQNGYYLDISGTSVTFEPYIPPTFTFK